MATFQEAFDQAFLAIKRYLVVEHAAFEQRVATLEARLSIAEGQLEHLNASRDTRLRDPR